MDPIGAGDPVATVQLKVPTLSERLEREEKMLSERLEKVQEIRLGLKINPEISKLLDSLTSLGHLSY
jgi:hypothetical protein